LAPARYASRAPSRDWLGDRPQAADKADNYGLDWQSSGLWNVRKLSNCKKNYQFIYKMSLFLKKVGMVNFLGKLLIF
jgi:hypothetical protein